MQGYSSEINAMGFRAIRLHYSASEEKNPQHSDPDKAKKATAWMQAAKRIFPDPLQWAQEFEIAWYVAQGTRVYPEFNETDHVLQLSGFRDAPIYRAWDFGWHAPACLIGQIDSKGRLILLKEIIGKEKTTKEFAQDVIARCAEWFPNQPGRGENVLVGTPKFTDFCDPAGQQVNAGASERNETRDVEILNNLGIRPSWEYGWSRKDGRSLVHQLLLLRSDATPSLYVNSLGCPILLQGFLGKYVYPARKGGTVHEEPDENNHPYADIHACLRYLCTGLYNALGLRKGSGDVKPVGRVRHHGYGTPIRR